jgi:ATP-dependent Lon protease
VTVKPGELEDYIGPARFDYGQLDEEDQVGIVTGLVVSDAGGDIVQVEATKMEGKDDFILTGQLGSVMQESARAGLSYIRSRCAALGLDPTIFEKQTIHVHVPAGATPKDGPSAGVTMATAMASLLTGRPVRRDIAMTGEITLRGRVLPIGGLKAKLLAAHLAGVESVIIPRRNEKDLVDVPDDVRKQLTIVPVDHMDQVLAAALLDQARPIAKPSLRALTPARVRKARRARKGTKAPVAAVPTPAVKPVKQPPATPPSGGA